MPRRQFPALAAAVIAAAGLVGVIYGVLLATTLAPATHTTGRVSGVGGAPVVDTANGVLDLDGPRVRITATAASNGPVFIGIARADDATAYLADAARIEVTRVADDGELTTVRAGSKPALPDPAGVDIWVASRTGTGTASLTWPDTPGPWRLVVAANGTDAPAGVALTWTRAPRSNSARAVVWAGALLLAAGASIGLLVARGRRRRAADGGDPGGGPDGGDPDGGDRGGSPASGQLPATASRPGGDDPQATR